MKKTGPLARLLLSRGFLLFLNLGAIAITIALSIREVQEHLSLLQGLPVNLHAFAAGAMLVAHGVVLEGRVIVVRSINKKFDLTPHASGSA